MFHKCWSEAPCLTSDLGWIHIIEYWQNYAVSIPLTLHDHYKFNEAVSFIVPCKDQAEVDRYWKALSAVPEAEQCGWVKARYGLSWQIVPTMLYRLLADPDRAKAGRVMEAMLKMKKLDVAALERAALA